MRASTKTRLWASEIGRCPRSAMLRILGFEKTREFPPIVKEAMQFGRDKETETVEELHGAFGEERVTTQMQIGNDLWSGHPDIVIDHGTDNPAIIEHKAVFGRWRGVDVLLERDVAQLCLYGQLYEEFQSDAFGVKRPSLLLFYRGRSASYLFEIYPLVRGGVDAFGVETVSEPLTAALMNRIEASVPWARYHIVKKNFNFDVEHRRRELERYYRAGVLPPRLPAPEHGKCTFRGEPSCLMFGNCWPYPVMLPFTSKD